MLNDEEFLRVKTRPLDNRDVAALLAWIDEHDCPIYRRGSRVQYSTSSLTRALPSDVWRSIEVCVRNDALGVHFKMLWS